MGGTPPVSGARFATPGSAAAVVRPASEAPAAAAAAKKARLLTLVMGLLPFERLRLSHDGSRCGRQRLRGALARWILCDARHFLQRDVRPRASILRGRDTTKSVFPLTLSW
jgi:hypothetical protein